MFKAKENTAFAIKIIAYKIISQLLRNEIQTKTITLPKMKNVLISDMF